MSYRIDIRRWERTDRPQPVYTGALALWEAPLYVPISAATRNSFRTPDAIRDKTYILQTAPGFGWISAGAGITTGARLSQVTVDQLATDTTALSVRLSQVVVDYLYDTTPAQLWPAIERNLPRSYRTSERAKLDVRRYEWSPQAGWIFTAVPPPTTAQLWPAIEHNLGRSYRTRERAKLDVRFYEWAPSVSSWISQVPAPPTPTTRIVTFISWNVSSTVLSWNVADTVTSWDNY